MKKRLLVIILCIISCFVFTGCRDIVETFLGEDAANRYFGKEEEVIEWREVSSREELSDGGNIKLTADIDFNYEMINGIGCKRIDGQGHTIKNCIITEEDYTQSASLFGVGTVSVQNLVLEGIEINSKTGSAAIVCVSNCESIENVTVRNSSITGGQVIYGSKGYFTGPTWKRAYVGAIYGGSHYDDEEPNEVFDCKILNCKVENVTIELKGAEDTSNSANIYVGGIAGACNTIEGCSVENCKITATSGNLYSMPYVGGLVGYTEGYIKNSVARNNTLLGKASWRKETLLGYETNEVYVGGIVGRTNGKEGDLQTNYVETCCAENNTLTAYSSGKVRLGGICGVAYMVSVKECYSVYNKLISTGGITDNKSPDIRSMGGLIGYAGGSKISSCFAGSNEIKEETLPMLESASLAGGLVGDNAKSVLLYCATRLNQLTALTTDEFCAVEIEEKPYQCFISGKEYSNVNDCGVVGEEFWLSEENIEGDLILIAPYWRFDGEYPTIDFSMLD